MNIPKGYKLVPVEPTVAMEESAAPECGGYCPRCDADLQIKTGIQVDIYRAMIDAAPTPPQPIYDEAKERELFEAYATSALGRDSYGYYIATDTYLRWQGWLACAQSRAKSVEVGHAAEDFDRVTAERDAALVVNEQYRGQITRQALTHQALQQRLTAADERVDVLEGLLQMFIDNSGDKDVVELCEHALKPAKMLPADHKCIECDSEYCHGVCVERGDSDDRLIG